MKSFIAVALMSIMLATACNDNQLSRVEQVWSTLSESESTIQTAVIKANNTVPPAIETQTATKIMQVMLRLDKATKDGIVATQNVTKLDDKTINNLAGLLAPILSEVNNAVNDPAILGISNQKTRESVQLGLISIQTTLVTTQTILLAAKKK